MPTQPAPSLEAQELISRLTPALAEGDLSEALETVRKHWTLGQLIELLHHANADIRKVAALSLGLAGDRRAIAPLAVALHDADSMVNQMAEHALWRIWFRLGKGAAICQVKHGSCHLNHGNYDVAVEKFTQAIEEDPDYAEAYNQRAIAHYLAERFDESIADCQAALARMPQHFGAMSGMGHCHAHQQHWAEARKCYRLALAMNPHLEAIEAALHQVEAILRERGEAGGKPAAA